MKKSLGIVLIAFLPAYVALKCYVCASGMTGCNDPFNATAYNVTTQNISSNTYCVKTMLTSSVISRYGSSSCATTPFISGVGTTCCQSDLCNTAQDTHQTPFLVILSFVIILFKFY